MNSDVNVGVRGRRQSVAVIEMARARVCWEDGRRQEGKMFKVLGDIVRVIA